MKPFIVLTENFIESEKTYTATPVSASGSPVSMLVDNNGNYIINDYIIIGRKGEETTEIKLVSGTPTGYLTVPTLSFDHKVSEPIVKIAFNQRRFYGCATKTGTYIFIETKDIEVDNPQGTYFSYTGVAYDWFKATYYNSITFEETDIADAIPAQADDVEHYCSIYDIREEAGFLDNPYISDGRINNDRVHAESEVKGSINYVYKLPLSEVPEIVKLATKLLAAGWLLYREYGSDAEGLGKNGLPKVKEARSILKSIKDGDILLLDSNDEELEAIDELNVSGFPDDNTEYPAQFKINDEF